MTKNKPALSYTRNPSLDGLRGSAALVVVFHHLLLTLPWFADRVSLGNLGPKGKFVFNFHNLFEYTPLHIFYGGTEAVVIFFVLSGYVLVNAINGTNLISYVRNRLVRLYFPIFLSVIFASLLVILVKRSKLETGSWWLNSHVISLNSSSLLRNLWVLDGTDWLDSSLWSMRYEIIFSLFILIFAGYNFKKSTKYFFSALFIIFIVVGISVKLNIDILSWLPIFFAGTALHWLDINKFLKSGFKLAIGIFVLFLPWYFAGWGYSIGLGKSKIIMTLGAVIIVDACRLQGTRVSKLLTKRPFQYLGKHSYSLYLIHAPILTTVWFALGESNSHSGWILRFCAAIIGVFIGSQIIYKFAEQPALNWIHKKSK